MWGIFELRCKDLDDRLRVALENSGTNGNSGTRPREMRNERNKQMVE